MSDMPPLAEHVPHIKRIEQAHPAWHAYWAFEQPWAYRLDDDHVAVRGEDWDDLEDEIVRKDAQLADRYDEMAALRFEENRQL